MTRSKEMKQTQYITLRPGRLLLTLLLILLAVPSIAQEKTQRQATREASEYLQHAEEALSNQDLETAEAYYRQAIAKDPSNATARYNMGNLYHDFEKPENSEQRHSQAAELALDKPMKHKAHHNQGNAFMAQKKYPEAIEAYKNALRADPTDDETRYNLALAKEKWEEEQEGGGGQDSEDQQGDNQDEDSENQDEQQDQGEEEQSDQADSESQGDQQNQDQQDQGQESDQGQQQDQQEQGEGQEPEQEGQPEQQQPIPGQLSPQQIQSLLDAMNNEERKVQDKINEQKAKGVRTESEKDW